MTQDQQHSAGAHGLEVTRLERTYKASVQDLWALWTTADGFESWWGPGGFRVAVRALQGRPGGELDYMMIADSPEMVQAMQQMGRPVATPVRARFSVFEPYTRLVITSVIDFVPGVAPYESAVTVEFRPVRDAVRMVVCVEAMHDEQFTQMAVMGFTSQLSKLDARFARVDA